MPAESNDRLIDEYFAIVESDAYERFGDIITDDLRVLPVAARIQARRRGR